MTVVGFTGTKDGMTEIQHEMVNQVLDGAHDGELVAHHGMCRGADTQFHFLVRARYPDAVIHGWPGVDSAGQSPSRGMESHLVDVLHDEMPYLERDSEIVREAYEAHGTMIAAPNSHIEKFRGSGTWATIRRARRRGVELYICYPDGMVQQERAGSVMVW